MRNSIIIWHIRATLLPILGYYSAILGIEVGAGNITPGPLRVPSGKKGAFLALAHCGGRAPGAPLAQTLETRFAGFAGLHPPWTQPPPYPHPTPTPSPRWAFSFHAVPCGPSRSPDLDGPTFLGAPMPLPLNVEYRPVATLIPRARNPRTHSPAQVANIAASIVEYGWTNPLLVDGDNGLDRGARALARRAPIGPDRGPGDRAGPPDPDPAPGLRHRRQPPGPGRRVGRGAAGPGTGRPDGGQLRPGPDRLRRGGDRGPAGRRRAPGKPRTRPGPTSRRRGPRGPGGPGVPDWRPVGPGSPSAAVR